jgi:hypothetical protein
MINKDEQELYKDFVELLAEILLDEVCNEEKLEKK